jgi:ACS family hexuronate transporter-like MFS transporter
MFLFWLPDFFAKRYNLDLEHFGPPLVVVYLVSDVGSISGGWLSSRLIRLGYTVNRARKLTMLLASVLVMPVMFAMHADNLWLAVAIVGVATGYCVQFGADRFARARATLQTRRNVVRVGAPASHAHGMSEMLIVTYVTVP